MKEKYSPLESERASVLPEKTPEKDPAQETERIFAEGSRRVVRDIESVLRDVDRYAEKLPQEASRLASIKERVKKYAKRALKTLELAAFGASLALVGNYERTRYDVDSRMDSNGELIYVHSDDETNRILDYLSGKIDLTPEERLNIYKDAWGDERIESLVKPRSIDSLTKEEFLDVLERRGYSRSYMEKEMNIPGELKYNPDLYRALWNIEMSCGKPRIRWESGGEGIIKGRDGRYDALTNTIYINPSLAGHVSDSVGAVIAEESHAEQFDERPFGTTANFGRDIFAIAGSMISSFEDTNTFWYVRDVVDSFIKDGKMANVKDVVSEMKEGLIDDLNEAQNDLYEDSGSVEYEAHKIIEPDLQSTLPSDSKEDERVGNAGG